MLSIKKSIRAVFVLFLFNFKITNRLRIAEDHVSVLLQYLKQDHSKNTA